jgi:archaellum component FlaC
MNIGDYLLKKNKITQKQREKAELEHEVSGNKFGKCCLDLGFINRTELNQAIKAVQNYKEKEGSPMPTEIGENSKFTFDLKFLITIGAVIVSACATYFTMSAAINELKSSNSPNRLEYEYVVKEIDNIKSMGDLKIISYKLDQYDEMFTEIKDLVKQLQPLASDLEYIKSELDKLKNKKIDIPDVDLSGLEDAIDSISKNVDSMKGSLESFEERLNKVEKRGGGRF